MQNEQLELAAVVGREPPAPLTQNDNGDCWPREWLNRHQDQKKCIKLSCFLFVFIFRVALYFSDLATDIILICEYWENREMWYFGFTLAFVVVPAVIISVINGLYYWEKWKVKRQIEQDDKYNLKEKLIVAIRA